MIIGAKNKANLLLAGAFETLGVSLWQTTEDGSVGQQGLVTEVMANILADSKLRPRCCLCLWTDRNVSGRRQSMSGRGNPLPGGLGNRICAVGLDCAAVVRWGEGWLTCLDGPVFSFNPEFNRS